MTQSIVSNMGAYLTRPITDTVSDDCENSRVRCGVSSMQGWRVSQEDSHNCCVDYDELNSMFAVYDGHGGHEVAQYASQEYPELLKKLKSYQTGDFETALIESFLEFDEKLKEANVIEILRQIASNKKADIYCNIDSSGLSASCSGIHYRHETSPDDSINGTVAPASSLSNVSITANASESTNELGQEMRDKDDVVEESKEELRQIASNKKADIYCNIDSSGLSASCSGIFYSHETSPDDNINSTVAPASSLSNVSITANTSESTNDLGQEMRDKDDVVEESKEEDNGNQRDLIMPGFDSGCTAVVALVTRDKIYVANAGDSRAVICKNGQAVDMSIDHKPEDPSEYDRIKAAGGYVTSDGRINGGLNLSRALGDHQYKASASLSATQQSIIALPDIKVNTITSDDEFLVLACDGIWNSLSSQNVIDFIKPLMQKKEKLSKICEMLLDLCLAPDTNGDGTGLDNMTCIIVQFLPSLIQHQQANLPNLNLNAPEKSQTTRNNETNSEPPEPMDAVTNETH